MIWFVLATLGGKTEQPIRNNQNHNEVPFHTS